MREQHLCRFGLPAPLEVTVDEWTLDTDENRRLRAATRTLLDLPGVPGPIVQNLLRLDRLLGEATLPTRGARIPEWAPTRLNARLLAENDSSWTSQQTMPLDDAGRLTIKPDLVLERTTGIAAVADSKYKLLDENGKIPNADAYQLVTYCARLGLKSGHLMYADGGPAPEPYEVIGADISIAVHRIDLTSPIPEIEAQVHALASVIAGALREIHIA